MNSPQLFSHFDSNVGGERVQNKVRRSALSIGSQHFFDPSNHGFFFHPCLFIDSDYQTCWSFNVLNLSLPFKDGNGRQELAGGVD